MIEFYIALDERIPRDGNEITIFYNKKWLISEFDMINLLYLYYIIFA